MSTPFPQELIDAVIGQIDVDDVYASSLLAACCQVSKSFLPASRARLWYKISLPDDDISAALLSSDELPQFVHTVCLDADCDLADCLETLERLKNVSHVEISGTLPSFSGEVHELMVDQWPDLKGITFRNTRFEDLGYDLFHVMQDFHFLKELAFITPTGYRSTYDDVVRGSSYDGPISSPETLYLDLAPICLTMLEVVFRDPYLFSLDRVQRLTLACSEGGDTDQRNEALSFLLKKISSSLVELTIKELSYANINQTIEISHISTVSFDVDLDEPAETIQWWTRNLERALEAQTGFAIKDITVNVAFYGAPFDIPPLLDLSLWESLDNVLSRTPEDVTIRVRVECDVEEGADAYTEDFVKLRDCLPLCRQRKYFYLPDTFRRVSRY